MDLLSNYVSRESALKLTVIGSSVVATQHLTTRGCNRKRWRYWARLSAGTTLGLLTGRLLSGKVNEIAFPTGSNVESSARNASVSKESDVSGM